MTLNERIAECRRLRNKARDVANDWADGGYTAELCGLEDARDGRPCDPDITYLAYEHRYRRGYEDAKTLLRLEERASVGA